MIFDESQESSFMAETNIHVGGDWVASAGKILERRWRKILVIGAVDRGKSTYCGYLSRVLRESGRRVAVVDADIGQKDIGPPASISLGYAESDVELSSVVPSSFYFVGAVSPTRHLLPMVIGTKLMVDIARSSHIIINTTGMVHGLGRVLKGFKIEAIRPDVIIGIERGDELRSLLRAYRNHPVIRLSPSPEAAMKSPEERRAARERSFAKYFSHAGEVTLSLRKLIFQRSLLFNGRAIEDPDHLYFEKTSEGFLAVSENRNRSGRKLQFITPGFEQNLLCGVADPKNSCLGMAIVDSIEFAQGAITLTTPVDPKRIRIIQPGDLYLTKEGMELNRGKPADFGCC
jgi:polynucleotide 5'-hydroxyl-kinase GRC3/NOL9